jgi:hypothetical protein
MRNLSAVVDDLGYQHVTGYLPARNVGKRVKDKIALLFFEELGVPGEKFEDKGTFQEKVKGKRSQGFGQKLM